MLALNSLQHDSQDTAIYVYDFYDNMTSRELASDVTWARQWQVLKRRSSIYYRLVSSTLEAVGVPMLVVS